MNKRKTSVFDGLFADNTVLSSLMVISPVIVCGNTLKNALAIIYVFSAVTFFSVVISSFVPKKIPYSLRIVLYAVISSLVYIPVRIAAESFYAEAVSRTGIYFSLAAVNSLIIFRAETKFFKMKKPKMTISLIFYILGFDLVMLVMSFIRELIAYGTINNKMTDIKILISGAGQPFGGFVLLGIFCGVYRKIRSSIMGNGGGNDVYYK